MRRSQIFKLSNFSLFQDIKKTLPANRKLFKLEARLIVRGGDESIRENPKSDDHRLLAKLAAEAYKREDFKGAYSLINKSFHVIKKYSIKLNDLDEANICELMGKICNKSHHIKQSVEYLEKSFSIMNRVLGEDNTRSAAILKRLAHSCLENLMADEAIKYCMLFLRQRNIQLKNIEELRLATRIDLSLAYCLNMEFTTAIKLLMSSLKISTNYFGKYNEYNCRMLLYVAGIYKVIENYDSSAFLFEKLIQIMRNMIARGNISKNLIYEILVYHNLHKGEIECSLYYAKQIIKNLRLLEGDSQPAVAHYYRLISNVYKFEGNYHKADHYSYKSRIILKRTVPESHPFMMLSTLDTTELLICLQKYQRALELIKKSYKKFLASSQNVYHLANYYFLKGYVYMNMSYTKTAVVNFNTAKSLLKSTIGKNNKIYKACLQYTGGLLLIQGYFDDSLAIFKRLSLDYERNYTVLSPLYLSTLLQIGIIYDRKGEIPNALKFYSQSIHIANVIGKRDENGRILISIANIHLKQGKLKLYYVYLTKALKTIMESDYGIICDGLHIYKSVSEYFISCGNFGAAKKAFKRMLKYQILSEGWHSWTTLWTMCQIAEIEIEFKNIIAANQLYYACSKISKKLMKKGKIYRNDQIFSNLYFIKAKLYYHYGNYSDSLANLKTVLQAKLSICGYKHEICLYEIYRSIAGVAMKLHQYNLSLSCFRVNLKIQLATYKNLFKIAEILRLMGTFHSNLNNLCQEIRFLRKSLQICQKLYDKENPYLKYCYHKIGINCHLRRDNRNAMRFLARALSNTDIYERMSSMDISILNSIGCVYWSLRKRSYIVRDIFERCINNARAIALNPIYLNTYVFNFNMMSTLIKNNENGTDRNFELKLNFLIDDDIL